MPQVFAWHPLDRKTVCREPTGWTRVDLSAPPPATEARTGGGSASPEGALSGDFGREGAAPSKKSITRLTIQTYGGKKIHVSEIPEDATFQNLKEMYGLLTNTPSYIIPALRFFQLTYFQDSQRISDTSLKDGDCIYITGSGKFVGD